ncbi:protein kinase superfamily protein [Anaeramoeba flamelloides]|uniref:non-specific serine/threonine protein kinase n=1 Tax=Anaeramoeba flamelloides TaxID=1746091 RepID=A0AAV8A093_9EUKA|nr:protein kinase superfamily protein [Anaeramoeba flamelloides]
MSHKPKEKKTKKTKKKGKTDLPNKKRKQKSKKSFKEKAKKKRSARDVKEKSNTTKTKKHQTPKTKRVSESGSKTSQKQKLVGVRRSKSQPIKKKAHKKRRFSSSSSYSSSSFSSYSSSYSSRTSYSYSSRSSFYTSSSDGASTITSSVSSISTNSKSKTRSGSSSSFSSTSSINTTSSEKNDEKTGSSRKHGKKIKKKKKKKKIHHLDRPFSAGSHSDLDSPSSIDLFSSYSETEQDSNKQDDYSEGGYHPTTVGELYKHRYKAIHKLGLGYFSTVWLVEDIKYGGKLVKTKTGKVVRKDKFLAMKIIKSARMFAQVSVDEIKILEKVTQEDPLDAVNVVKLRDRFLHEGPNGKHICMVFEFLDQKDLLSLIRKYGVYGLPIPIVKVITRQILSGLDHLHTKCKIIHTDIKPENIMLFSHIGKLPKRMEKIAKNLKINSISQEDKAIPDQDQVQDFDLGSKNFLLTNQNESTNNNNIQSKSGLIKTLVGSRSIKKRKSKRLSSFDIVLPNDSSGNLKNNTNKNKNPNPNENRKKRIKNQKKLQKKLNIKKIKCKIVDLGNACWFDKHFSTGIQTREYRSPEVILGHEYDWTADIWSLGCLVFELLTGELMFTPSKGSAFSKSEDHLAMIMETLGKIPKNILTTGSKSQKVADKNGNLLHIKKLNYWPLERVLQEKHNFNKKDAKQISEFLLLMFKYNLSERKSAQELLKHPWLLENDENKNENEKENENGIIKKSEKKKIINPVKKTDTTDTTDTTGTTNTTADISGINDINGINIIGDVHTIHIKKLKRNIRKVRRKRKTKRGKRVKEEGERKKRKEKGIKKNNNIFD